MTPCRLLSSCRCFGGASCLHHQGPGTAHCAHCDTVRFYTGTDKDSNQDCLEPEDGGTKLLRQSVTIVDPTRFRIPEE